MKTLVTLATTFALAFGLMGTMVQADSDGDRDRSNARRLAAHHQRVEQERLTRHQRQERKRSAQ